MPFTQYTSEELQQRGDTPSEHLRMRTIFEEMKSRLATGGELSPIEGEFYCFSVTLLRNEGRVEDHFCCNNWRFKMLFLRYWHDLDGTGNHEYTDGTRMIQPTPSQIEQDLKDLALFSEEWNQTIQITNHSEESLKYVAKETRDELKALRKEPVFNLTGYLIESRLYDRQKQSILNRLKYAYLMSEEIFDREGTTEISIPINGQQLVFNKYSSVHIINRHFAGGQKVVNLDKTFNSKDLLPNDLINQLRQFIRLIDASGLYINNDIMKIRFQYKGHLYSLWSQVAHKQVRGSTQNIPYNRIQTLYPVKDQDELDEINRSYILREINFEFSVYVNP